MLTELNKKLLTNHLLDYIKYMEKLKDLPTSGSQSKKEIDLKIAKYLTLLIDITINT